MSRTKIVFAVLAFLIAGTVLYSLTKYLIIRNVNQAKVNVWDTYVTKKDGNIMHFDIIAPVGITDTSKIYAYGKEYLKTKGQESQPITSRQCKLCHVARLRPQWQEAIDQKGYYIIEMEGCN